MHREFWGSGEACSSGELVLLAGVDVGSVIVNKGDAYSIGIQMLGRSTVKLWIPDPMDAMLGYILFW